MSRPKISREAYTALQELDRALRAFEAACDQVGFAADELDDATLGDLSKPTERILFAVVSLARDAIEPITDDQSILIEAESASRGALNHLAVGAACHD
jgi:hypothetical protein